MVIMVMLFMVLVFGRPGEAMKFTSTTPGHCLSPDHVQLSTTAIMRRHERNRPNFNPKCANFVYLDFGLTYLPHHTQLHCSTSCIRDGQCQGFCFQSADSSCLITYTEQATVLGGLQASAGAAIYFIGGHHLS
ncbi:hypothetical protein Pcinc_016423 [Petrolisthes cinctipes]|uniref:Apple domain-containing protein n=1 Tax=Petrolisthes cinctipes TaxID=88211 RepID=A0AAE1KNT3_PETCI|nr:hypothetical protein Pcinc_016423 [Petrolisthes cinctipes]